MRLIQIAFIRKDPAQQAEILRNMREYKDLKEREAEALLDESNLADEQVARLEALLKEITQQLEIAKSEAAVSGANHNKAVRDLAAIIAKVDLFADIFELSADTLSYSFMPYPAIRNEVELHSKADILALGDKAYDFVVGVYNGGIQYNKEHDDEINLDLTKSAGRDKEYWGKILAALLKIEWDEAAKRKHESIQMLEDDSEMEKKRSAKKPKTEPEPLA